MLNNKYFDNKICDVDNNYIKITALRHEWPEKKDFVINKKKRYERIYVFTFFNPR